MYGAIIRRVRLIHNLGCDCDCGRRRLISGPQQRRRQRASRQFVLASSVHASLSTPKLPITRSQTTPRPTINDRSCLRPTRHQSDLLLYFFVRVCPPPRRAGPGRDLVGVALASVTTVVRDVAPVICGRLVALRTLSTRLNRTRRT